MIVAVKNRLINPWLVSFLDIFSYLCGKIMTKNDMTMKMKFTIPYRAHWGESLHVALSYLSRDGYVSRDDLAMQTKDGYLWQVETTGKESRQHPYVAISYYYVVEDEEGKVLRVESGRSRRSYTYDSTKNYTFDDFWLEDIASDMCVKPQKLGDVKIGSIPMLPIYDRTVIFKVSAPMLIEGEAIAILGNHPTLGNWNPRHYLKMIPTADGDWILSVNVMALESPLEYKYVVIDEKEQRFKRWEVGENRNLGGERVYDQDVFVVHGGDFRIKQMPDTAQFNFDTYVFDLDGTLLSTLGDLAASCNYALCANDMPQHSIDDVRRFVGNGVKKLMERAVPDGLSNPAFEKTYQDFRQHYMHHNLDTTQPYPGVMEMLRELKDRGKKIAVVSNKFYAATQALCRHFFGDLVDVAIGEREDIQKKPAPDTVNEALRQLKSDRFKAVYIGDSDVDVMTARNSGMPCISVLWGFRDKAFLVRHDATIFVTSPLQIL